LFIVGETNFHVRHCLLAASETDPKNVTRVLSHPQALAQCDDYLRTKGLTPVAFSDTAGSAKHVAKEKLKDTASIASQLAAEKYGLQIIASGIEDDKQNFTRFIILSLKDSVPPPNVPAKTSIVFSLIEQIGALYKALSVFVLRDIDLTKIESRPGRKHLLTFSDDVADNSAICTINKKLSINHETTVHFKDQWKGNHTHKEALKQPYQVLFYLDFSASISDISAYNALLHLSEIAPFIRVLGSYPSDGDCSQLS